MKHAILLPCLFIGLSAVAGPLLSETNPEDPVALCTQEAEQAGFYTEADVQGYVDRCLERYQDDNGAGNPDADPAQEPSQSNPDTGSVTE